MSASKKNTSKSTTSPTPATNSVPAKTVAKKKTAAATVQSTTPTPVAMLAPTPAPVAEVPVAAAPVAAAPAPASPAAINPIVSKPVLTTISARIDVGFGNALFVRGEGAGLSWETGLAMECAENDLWQIVLTESARAYTFKFLVNDVTWSAGPDFTAACGTNVTFTPEF